MEDFAVGVLPNDNPIAAIMQSGYNLGYDTGYRAGQKAARPKWISVEERLPEPGNKILIAFPHSILGFTLHVGEYTGKIWWMESAIIDAPPYWMPLPEPPKE